MRHIIGLVAVFAVANVPMPVLAQTVTATPATITVSGSASVSRMPDQTVVAFGIVTTDDVAARASGRNNEIYSALTRRLAALGITGSAVRTTSYGLTYTPRPAANRVANDTTRYGYTVSRSVSVTQDRTDNAGAIVDAGIGAGATEVNNVSFTVKDRRAAYDEALRGAVADAQTQANVIASAAHVRIVGIRSISNGGGAPVPLYRMSALAMPAPAPPTQIDAGPLEINANVTVIYAIAP